jgi:hypothetical protein
MKEHTRQVMEAFREIRMLFPLQLSPHLQRLATERLSLRIFPQAVEYTGEVVKSDGDLHVDCSVLLLGQFQREAKVTFRGSHLSQLELAHGRSSQDEIQGPVQVRGVLLPLQHSDSLHTDRQGFDAPMRRYIIAALLHERYWVRSVSLGSGLRKNLSRGEQPRQKRQCQTDAQGFSS